MIEQAFYDILTNDTGISALFSGEIYPHLNPDPSSLYLVYSQYSRNRPARIDSSMGKQVARFQVDIYGDDSYAVASAAETVISSLNYKANNSYGHNIQIMRLDSERSEFEYEDKRYRKSLDFSVFFD